VEYMLLIYGDEAAWAARPEDERLREMERHVDFERSLRAVRGQGLAPSAEAVTVRMSDGKPTFTDGPVRGDEGAAGRLLHRRVQLA
jgi:hypothetical protein